MTNTIIKNAVAKNDLNTAIKFASKLPVQYANYPAAQAFQIKAIELVGAYDSKIGALESLVGHNFITVEVAINSL